MQNFSNFLLRTTTTHMSLKSGKKIEFLSISLFPLIYFFSIVFTIYPCLRGQDTAGDQSQEKKKARIALMNRSDFIPDRPENKGMIQDGQTGLPDELASRITGYLSRSNRFTPVDRKALRRVVLEQRFGEKVQDSYKEKTVQKAISDMNVVSGNTVAETGELANTTDLVKDFKDLGSAVQADYLVAGDLDRLEKQVKEIDVPYTDKHDAQQETVDAVLRIRVVDVKKGIIKGARDINTRLSQNLLSESSEGTGEYEIFDRLAQKASSEIIDIVFPPAIVKTNPLIISRGTNNGVKKGMVFKIQRNGEPIKDQRVTVGYLKQDIGKVKVKRVQKNISIVEPIEGSDFQKQDRAIRASNTTKETTETDGRSTDNKEPENSGKPRVAVRLIKEGSTARTGSDAGEHTTLFTDTIISGLTETERFRVLDRQEVGQLLDEQTASALAKGETLEEPMGNLSGADYLIYGNLSLFDIETKTIQVPGTDRKVQKNVGNVEGNIRYVNASSGQVIASEKISLEKQLDANEGRDELKIALADEYARNVVSSLMNELFAMKVAAVRDETVYLNRGKDGGLSQGDVLDVYTLGKVIKDPETGESLGRSEQKIGTVKIVSVEEARSKARIESGKTPKRGDLLKRTEDQSQEGTRARKSEETGESGLKDGQASMVVGNLQLTPSGNLKDFNKQTVKTFVDQIVAKLSGTGRFKVLDRQYLDQVLDQQTLNALVSGQNPTDKLKQLTEADYILNGQISSFYIDTEKSTGPYTGETTTKRSGIAEGTVRLVDIRTGEIVDAGTSSLEMEFEKDNESSAEYRKELMDRFATDWVRVVGRTLFPIKILGITGNGTLYINRGSSAGIKAGSVYDLMRSGEQLIDEETGTRFGRAEEKIGKVKITSVERSRSRATLVEGQTPKKGDILRNPRMEMENEEKDSDLDENW